MSRQVRRVSRRAKKRRHPPEQVIEQSRVRGIVYAAVSGCRAIVLSHKLA
jgi:hypothetical protein